MNIVIAGKVAAANVLASFISQARGIMFYDVSLSSLTIGTTFTCQLEPFNPRDANCIGLFLEPDVKLGHLAKEDAAILSTLLQESFWAKG